MALCELKSEEVIPAEIEENEDLEDGEIEDDEEEEVPPSEEANKFNEKQPLPQPSPQLPIDQQKHEKYDRQKFERRSKHEDGKKKSHLTEAEKSVMLLHKMERMEREKRDKFRREPGSAGGVDQPFPNFTHHTFNKFTVDDFASNIEKQIASVLKKERTISDEDKDDEKRGRKRKKRERDRRKQKQRKTESPKSNEDIDDGDMMNIHEGILDPVPHHHGKDMLPKSEESHTEDSDEVSSDRSNEERRERRRERRDRRSKNRERNKERREMNREKKGAQQQQMQQQHQQEMQPKDAQHLCVYYLQGKCQKGDECPYSHESQPPMKWELCKFYLNECCAKGDKCLYMHSDFPCKFYHTGQPCLEGENCKFAHGKPLSDRLKQILFKHIETAPKDILGRFPRMSRDEAIYKITQRQMGLETLYGVVRQDDENIPSLFDLSIPMPMEFIGDPKGGDKDKTNRNRPSRWQDSEMLEKGAFPDQRKPPPNFNMKGFPPGQDLDMRLPSNGDIDMRTLQMSIPPPTMLPPSMSLPPPNMSVPPPNMLMMMPPRMDDSRPVDIDQYKREATKLDVDIRNHRGDTDIRNLPHKLESPRPDTDSRQMDFFNKKDTDNRLPAINPNPMTDDDEAEPKLQIVCDDELEKTEEIDEEVPANLPKRQRELFIRIQAQQKENLLEQQHDDRSDAEENAIDWYSDDSNEGKLTIKCDDDVKDKEDENKAPTSPVKASELVQKLGDLSKFTIPEEVSKLLSSLSGGSSAVKEKPRDPRQSVSVVAEEVKPVTRPDPRKARLSSTEGKPKEKLSIYEQGSIVASPSGKDVDLRSDSDLRPDFRDLDLRNSRPDIDLRQLGLPFKAMQNYQPATEIDASYSSHLPIAWTVHIVEIPKPDYTGLKLSAQEAQTTGDPRLRKLFRLDLDEKDSPASPKQSPKAATTTVRVDPRIRKTEETKTDPSIMSYAQQMNMLQGSLFYQNLTSNQKVKLNQELAMREPNTAGTNEQILMGILSTLGLIQGQQGPPNMSGTVLSLLSTISSMAQMSMNPIMGGVPGIMPGIPQGAMMGQQVNPNILSQNPNMGQQGLGNMGGNHEYPINFDPRNGGLLGNAPPFVNFPPENQNFNNFNDDNFYPENNGNFNGNRDNRFNRENRGGGGRRGRNFARNRNNNFRNRNRANRGHAAS